MRNKKVFLISSDYIGGTVTFFYQNFEFLHKKKIQTYLLCNKSPQTRRFNNKNKIFFFKNLINSIKFRDILTKRAGIKNIIYLSNPFFFLKNFFFFRSLGKKNTILIILHSGLLNISVKRIIGSFLFTFLIFQKNIKLFYGSSSSKRSWELYFPWIRLKKNKIYTNGIKLKSGKNINKKVKFKISFIGRLFPEKDPEKFCKIAKHCIQYKNKFNFNIFGDGILKNYIHQKYKKFVRLQGWKEQIEIFKNTDLLLVTSPVENYPYVVLEAKSHGIPTIYDSKGDISKLIENNKDGFFCINSKEETFLKYIKKIFKNYDFFKTNCLKNAKKYNENILLKKFWEQF